MAIDVMIAGVQKAGTTSLLRYLATVDGVSAQHSLEFPYFANDKNFEEGFEAAARRWLPADVSGTIVAKSVGVMYLPWARERLHDHNANCKLIVCLREPVDRAYSAYWYLRKTGQEDLDSFERAIDAEPGRLASDFRANHHFAYLDRGRYATQIDELVRLFGRENVHLLSSSRLRADPAPELDPVLSFIGVDRDPAAPAFTTRTVNAAGASRSPALARLLHGHQKVPGIALARGVAGRFPGAVEPARRMLRTINRRADFVVPPLDAKIRQRLVPYFAESNRLLVERYGFDVERSDVGSNG